MVSSKLEIELAHSELEVIGAPEYTFDDLQSVKDKINDANELLNRHLKDAEPVERILGALCDAGLGGPAPSAPDADSGTAS